MLPQEAAGTAPRLPSRPLHRRVHPRPHATTASQLAFEGASGRVRSTWSPRQHNNAHGGGVVSSVQAGTVLLTAVFVAVGKVLYSKLMGGRAAPQSSLGIDQSSSVEFSVATFNLRGVMDRWQERRPLLGACIKQLDADVLCFQEVLTGEFEQDRQLLDVSYHVFPCKAALFNLLSTGGLARWYARRVADWLRLAPLQRVMVRLPPWVEAWRERYRLSQDLFRNIRDLTMAPFFGNSVACRLARAHEINHSTLVLGDWRAAQRIEFCLGNNHHPHSHAGFGSAAGDIPGSSSSSTRSGGSSGGSIGLEGLLGPAAAAAAGGGAGSPMKFWVVNTHLDHYHTDNRQRQALEVCRWMDQVKHDCAAIVLCGDLNGGPNEMFHAALRERGYVSAYVSVHGHEPQVLRGTWPTGIQAPLMDHGDFECLDYVYVWAAPGYSVEVLSAELFGLEPAPHDATLYPSDHAALRVGLRIRRDPSPLPSGVEVAATAAAKL